MDESTRKRMEQKNFKEMESDQALIYAQCFHKGKLSDLSLVDAINYVYEKASSGVARSRIKELFIRDIIDPMIFGKQEAINTVNEERECAKYNY